MFQAALVTFDVDWAPEWAIELCAELCANAGVKATFFATHPSPFLAELAADSRFEVGVHPNFLPRSTHGDSPEAVMRTCLSWVPDARAMRTHSLVQSSPIFELVGAQFGQIQTDMSLFLPFHDGLQPVDFFPAGRRMIRLPYQWEDDVAATWPGWNWDSAPVLGDGLAAVDFHPILVALNSTSLSSYRELKSRLGSRHLTAATREEIAPLIQDGPGARTYLEDLLKCLGKHRILTASEAAEQWIRNHQVPNSTLPLRPVSTSNRT